MAQSNERCLHYSNIVHCSRGGSSIRVAGVQSEILRKIEYLNRRFIRRYIHYFIVYE
jgi:hypothetical protein